MEIYQSKLLFQVFPSTSAVQSSITLSNNIWYHLVGTYNSGTINLYVNGISSGSGNYTYSASSENLILGRYYAGSLSLEGQLSNVKFYNKALSQQEILQNFNATRFRYGI